MPYHRVTDAAKLHALLDAVMVIESDLDLAGLLHRIVESAIELVGARYGALGVLSADGDGLDQFVHAGLRPEQVERIGSLPSGKGILGLLIHHPAALRLERLSEHPDSVGFPSHHPPMTSFLGMPVRVRGQVFGNLYLTDKIGAAGFTEEDEQLVAALATAAGMAVENARLHAKARQLTLAEDRERIARDLHDTVIQRLFAVGLSLQAVEGASSPEVRDRLRSAIDDLDGTIRQVRTAIFALDPPPAARLGLRAAVVETCNLAARGLGCEPGIRFSGALDALPPGVEADVLAVLRETLANAARHANPSRVGVSVQRGDRRLRLVVSDDGAGFQPAAAGAGAAGAGRGLLNVRRRAEAHGGTATVESAPGRGTKVSWEVPVD